MHALKCERCEKQLKDDDIVYVIDVRTWCEDCFKSSVLPSMKMYAKDYFNAYAVYHNQEK